MNQAPVILSSARWQAVIFDLDGVVTRTAGVHAAAWKELFDAFLAARASRRGENHEPFDPDGEYLRYVDGKPRYDGVESFLASRGIELPRGEPDDPPGDGTVCALGNRKNEIFRRRLRESGVEVYRPAVDLLRKLRREGIATAVVSSSRNTRAVLEAAELGELFDARVDGVEAERLGLDGKPAPDVFVEAARRLGADPAATVVVEDAISGVEAGRRGGFGMVIGVARTGAAEQLEAAGADLVVGDLAGVRVVDGAAVASGGEEDLPSALEHLGEIVDRAQGSRRLAVFLDYDGTLTPIVERPEDAVLSDAARRAVAELAEACPVAVISGRDLDDVRAMVGLEEIHYAGSHGFDIAGPEVTAQRGAEFLPDLDRAQRELEDALEAVPGARVERKRFAVAVHFRQVADERAEVVRRAVERVHARHRERLSRSGGKKIWELRPAIDWHKGRALSWLISELGLEVDDTVPVYIGDDTTDEDAFREIGDRGVGIVVRDDGGATAARYRLADPEQVRRFLVELADSLKGGDRG